MAREAVWYTLVNGIQDSSSWSVSLVDGPGTVQRVVGQLGGGHASAGVGAFASFHYIVGVGVTAPNPAVFGLDSEKTMLHGDALIPNPNVLGLTTTAPQLAFDSEGQRVVGATEKLWLAFAGGVPATLWSWVFSIRVLLLLPEA